MDLAEEDALLAMQLTPGIGQTFVAHVCEGLGSATAALGASARQLAEVAGRLSVERAGKLRRALDQTLAGDAVPNERALLQEHAVRLVGLADAAYPRLLRYIGDPPALLWVRGELCADDALALGIVGSRKCTHYGREQAGRFAQQAAQVGLCVVSGGAYGIDAAAHRAAIAAGGRTLVILGSGLARPYPFQHAELFDQVAAGAGAVISELPMTTSPRAENFPRRNRIVSGLSLGILVVEAAGRSGALITARLCVEDHGRELMAVPGRVDSRTSDGCHKMIREGWAKLVTNIADVLDSLGEAGQLLKATVTQPATTNEPPADDAPTELFAANLTESQRRVVEALDQPRTLEQLAAATSLAVGPLQADLTLLEIRGAVVRRGGVFTRRTSG